MSRYSNTIGTSMLQCSVIFQFIAIALYSVYLHFFRSQIRHVKHSVSEAASSPRCLCTGCSKDKGSSDDADTMTSTTESKAEAAQYNAVGRRIVRPAAVAVNATATTRTAPAGTVLGGGGGVGGGGGGGGGSRRESDSGKPSAQDRCPKKTFCRGRFLRMLRGVDLCTPAVFLLAHAAIFVSAADTPYSACTLLLIALALPFQYFRLAAETRRSLEPDEATAERRVARALLIAEVLTVGLLVSLHFTAPLSRLKVDEEIKRLINETPTGVPRIPSIDVPLAPLALLVLVLLAPKRLTRKAWSAAGVVPALVAYFFVVELWTLDVQGEQGSFEYAFTTIMKYCAEQWGGRIFVHVIVVVSSLMHTINPLWFSDFDMRTFCKRNDAWKQSADVENQLGTSTVTASDAH